MSHTAPRTLVFGLDGFDFGFAQHLVSTGLLPWFAEQFKHGSLVSTKGSVLQGSEWVSAACGVSAAYHRYVHTTQLPLGSYEEVEIDARDIRAERFYVPLTRAGVRTVVVDLPADAPCRHQNLLQIIDWGSEFNLWHFSASTRELRKYVETTFGRHPLTNYGSTRPDDSTLVALHGELRRGTALKGRLIRELMRREPDWQFLFAGFGEVHKGGHFFWQYQDPAHPQHAGPDHPLATALVELYQLLDSECAQICAEAGTDINVVIVADRGMQANLRGDHLVGALLERWGLFAPSGVAPAGSAIAPTPVQTTWSEQPETFARRIKRRIPVRLRPLVRRLMGRDRADWQNTRVFQVPEVGTSYLRVNLRGREPLGTVTPGAEYEALLAFLERELKALVNPATGRCPVAEVVFPQRTFAGPYCAELPDVGIVWAVNAPVAALESPTIGRIEGAFREQRSGNHTSDGGMLFSGPDFASGVRRPGDLRELAPTLLALYGVPIPSHYEFRAVPELTR